MTTHPNDVTIRAFSPADETGWLRCRVLAFLSTQYYDDVWQHRPQLSEPSFGLVAVDAEQCVVGLLDVRVDGAEATIDTVAVHPDHQDGGIATGLLDAALARLSGSGVSSLDAWTREDPAANAWYRRMGFTEQDRYLHVHLSDGDDADGFVTPPGFSNPVSAFVHVGIEREAEVRSRFARVYVCRQYQRDLHVPSSATPAG
ncbi:GNAT family N-acetyltransferase [Plantibacter sp. VKM Ac-2880]|uniref:GNAT family N-acetyltransferase n=1 Tax=Plantibacter sp. VKM Ac-2880 TaxID=2783827 RepID=UPI00351CA274